MVVLGGGAVSCEQSTPEAPSQTRGVECSWRLDLWKVLTRREENLNRRKGDREHDPSQARHGIYKTVIPL